MDTKSLGNGGLNAVIVGGRTFCGVVDTTFEQDMHIMRIVQEAGLIGLAERYEKNKGDLDKLAIDVLVTAFGSGKLFALTAAILHEEGKEWTIDSSNQNADFFAKLTKKADKDALRKTLVAVILGFFVSGLLASPTSGVYLKSQAGSDQPEDAGLALNEVSSSSGIGTPLSANLEDSTRISTHES